MKPTTIGGPLVVLTIIALIAVGCDSTRSSEPAVFSGSDIEGFTVESHGASKSGQNQYLVSLKVRDGVDPAVLPDGFSLSNSTRQIILHDKGTGADKDASDLTYTAVVEETDLPEIEEYTGKDLIKVTCEIDTAWPGEEICGRTCPDKSLLGYENVICVCITNCKVEISI